MPGSVDRTRRSCLLASPSMRELLLTIHILAAAAWIGGGLFASLSFRQLVKTKGVKSIAALEESLGSKFFGSAVGLLLLSGIGLVLVADEFGFGEMFVLIGIGVVVVNGIVEGAFVAPRAKKITEADEDRSADYLKLLTEGSMVQLALMVFAVWAMVAKLGL